jgi:hypothetical protein
VNTSASAVGQLCDATRRLQELIPPGYELTPAAKTRLAQLAAAPNRHEHRRLLSYFRKHPIKTFRRESAAK